MKSKYFHLCKFLGFPVGEAFPKKNIQWSELDNVVIKDNVLTIDFKNNNLIQHTFDQSENETLDEVALNQFVKSHLQ